MSSFLDLTEAPGEPATAAQLERMRDRYRLVRDHAEGGRLLEVACGTAIGLRSVAPYVRLAVGGDVDPTVLARAAADGAPPLVLLDAQALPFGENSFDTIAIAEALYYVPDAGRFFREAHRVLAPGGRLLITTVNAERSDFIPSPRATRYLRGAEIQAELSALGFEVELFGSFADPPGWRSRVLSLARTVVSRLGLVPGTLRGRLLLKRLAYGRLQALPATLEIDGPGVEPEPTTPGTCRQYVILHAVARRLGT